MICTVLICYFSGFSCFKNWKTKHYNFYSKISLDYNLSNLLSLGPMIILCTEILLTSILYKGFILCTFAMKMALTVADYWHARHNENAIFLAKTIILLAHKLELCVNFSLEFNCEFVVTSQCRIRWKLPLESDHLIVVVSYFS